MTNQLTELFKQEKTILAPGCFSAMSAVMIQKCGFKAAYLSGANVAYNLLGRQDIGLVTFSEIANNLAYIRERVNLPLIVDADTGFGNEVNTARTVKLLEKFGANAIQLEDQVMPKRCGHLSGKQLITKDEMCKKLIAARESSCGSSLIIARTDAIAVEGLVAALDRAHSYIDAGAQMIFVEAPTTLEQIQQISKELSSKTMLMANMVVGNGKTPLLPFQELSELNFKLVIYPGALIQHVMKAGMELLTNLNENKVFDSQLFPLYTIEDITSLLEKE